MSLTCGIDVGGTKIAGAVVDAKGMILEESRVESPATDREAIEAAIATLVADLRTRHEVESVGIGFAGYVDASRARVLFAPNLAMRDLDLRAELQEHIDLPVIIENDANAAAWGEFAFGAGEDVDDQLMVTVGTGVGGGLVLNGELYRGAYGVAAEIGHLRVVPDGHLCGCGKRGCLEQYGSGSALVRDARVAAGGGSEQVGPLLARAGGRPEAITGPLITEAAQDGDPFAVELLAALAYWLGGGIASLAAVLDPAAVVIGGGVSEAGDLLLDPMRAAFESHLSGFGHHPTAEIRLATLGNKAGVIGAADLARR
jgi:glucokinase